MLFIVVLSKYLKKGYVAEFPPLTQDLNIKNCVQFHLADDTKVLGRRDNRVQVRQGVQFQDVPC